MVKDKEAFGSAMDYPMNHLRDRFGELTLHKKPAVVHNWPGKVEKEELAKALLHLDGKYSDSVRT